MSGAVLQAELASDCGLFDEGASARSRSSVESRSPLIINLRSIRRRPMRDGRVVHWPYAAISGDRREDFVMRKPRKMTSRDRQRLADSVTFAAMDATQKDARNRFNR